MCCLSPSVENLQGPRLIEQLDSRLVFYFCRSQDTFSQGTSQEELGAVNLVKAIVFATKIAVDIEGAEVGNG